MVSAISGGANSLRTVCTRSIRLFHRNLSKGYTKINVRQGLPRNILSLSIGSTPSRGTSFLDVLL
jgi:hypothetical protein